MRELYLLTPESNNHTMLDDNHTMLDDCTLHTVQGATARQLGFAWHAAMFWDDNQASASRLCMNQLQRHSTSRAVAYVSKSVIETQARGSCCFTTARWLRRRRTTGGENRMHRQFSFQYFSLQIVNFFFSFC